MGKFKIELDQSAVDSTIREIESSSFFQSLINIKGLELSDEEQALIFEIARRKELSLAQLIAVMGAGVKDTLARMVKEGYLVKSKEPEGEVYRLSVVLNPPKPITPAEAIKIQRKMAEAGKQSVLEAYIRELQSTLGTEGLKVIERIMYQKGLQLADQVADVKGQGARIVGLRFIELMRAMGTPIDVINITDKEVRFRVKKCAYNLQPGESELCRAVSAFDHAVIEKLGCTISYPITVPKGDDCCEGVIKSKSSVQE
jgi:hypothetical protein